MRWIIILVLMVRAAEVQAQIKTFDSVNIFVAQIAANGKFESEYVGFAGSPSQQFQAMQSLKRVSTAEELFLLTPHRNPVVRLYAFIALTEKNDALAAKAFSNLKRDTASVFTLNGCIGGSEKLSIIATRYFRQGE